MKATHLDGRSITVEGRDYLYFYGTSYLGLPYDEDFKLLVQEGQRKYGSSLGSSPLSSPQLEVYSALEQSLASYYGFESALLFASGYSAGQTIVQLFDRIGKVSYGNIVHPAIKLEKQSETTEKKNTEGRGLHVVDYIDPIEIELGNLDIILDPADTLLIDASHALGLFDDEVKMLSKSKNICVSASLNKALGINAGVVLCDHKLKSQLLKSSRYVTSSAPSPAECYALFKALKDGLIKQQRDHLLKLCELLDKNLSFTTYDPMPVLIFDDTSQRLYDYFTQSEILIWRNQYPPSSKSMVNRAVISAAHHPEDIKRLMDILKATDS